MVFKQNLSNIMTIVTFKLILFSVGLSSAEFWNFRNNCQNLATLICIIHFQNRRQTKHKFNWYINREDIIFNMQILKWSCMFKCPIGDEAVLSIKQLFYGWSSKDLWQWWLICSINLFDGIHCLKCFSHNVSGVESTPVFRWGFVVRTTVLILLLFFLIFIVVLPWPGFEPTNFFIRQFFELLVRNANH